MNNNQRSRDYMAEHKFTCPDVARPYNVTVPTIIKWLQPETTAEYQKMPDKSLEIFVKKLSRN